MEGDKVRLAEQGVKIHIFAVVGLHKGGIGVGIVGKDLHLKAGGALNDALADPAGADDAQSLVPHLDASDGLVVPTGADGGVHRTNISGSGEHQGHGQIGHRVTVGPGSDRDLDPHGMSGLQVYLIISNTVAGDDLQIFGRLQHGAGVGLQTSDDSIGLGQLFQQLCLKIVHGKADHSTALLLQQANGGIVVLGKGTWGGQYGK